MCPCFSASRPQPARMRVPVVAAIKSEEDDEELMNCCKCAARAYNGLECMTEHSVLGTVTVCEGGAMVSE